MEKLKLHTPDSTADNIAKLAAIFPNCIVEVRDESGRAKKAVDFDQLRQELSNQLVEGSRERYHVDWPGKKESLLAANAPIAKTLRPVRDESVHFDTTKHLFIEGDNLDALKLLQEAYLNRVKLIYIDPPYNTGSEFIYDDDFSIDPELFLIHSNQKSESGDRLVQNLETNGRFHSDWLSMMYPRLRLARQLLKDDGFIVVSIDDAEIENMKSLLNEVFGKQNEMAVLVWDRNRKNDAKFFSVGHEYMCVYAKNKQWHIDNSTVLREPKPGFDEAKEFFLRLKSKHRNDFDAIQEEWRSFYNGLRDSDERKKLGRFSKIGERGPYRDDGDISWPGGGGPKYEVLHPVTKRPCKVPKGGWVYPTKGRFDDAVSAGRVVFGPDETTLPRQARYLFDGEGQVMPSVFYSYAQTATLEFVELMGARVFENPKNWKDLKRMVSYLSKGSDIVLDFFAGSCSTAHAVLEANLLDGGARQFIMVQLDEMCAEDSVAAQSGYRTIADIGRDRIRRAAQSSGGAGRELARDVGFRSFKVDSSNMKEVYYSPDATKQADLLDYVENIREDRSPEDLLFQVLIDWGVDLSLPIAQETIDGKTVFFVDQSALAACFDHGVSEELVKKIAARKPLRVVFRDVGFSSDAVKINVEQIFKLASPGTEVKAI